MSFYYAFLEWVFCGQCGSCTETSWRLAWILPMLLWWWAKLPMLQAKYLPCFTTTKGELPLKVSMRIGYWRAHYIFPWFVDLDSWQMLSFYWFVLSKKYSVGTEFLWSMLRKGPPWNDIFCDPYLLVGQMSFLDWPITKKVLKLWRPPNMQSTYSIQS